MKYNKNEFEKYPEIMTKEQMRVACHISKRTALFLLQYDLIPHICNGKKTRCYRIRKSDIIAFILDRELNPDRYIAPKNWYGGKTAVCRPDNLRIFPELPEDDARVRRYYEQKLKDLPDVVDVADIVEFTGYDRRAVGQWIRLGKLKSLTLPSKYVIPKCYLIDWLASPTYNSTNRKSRKHIDMLWELYKWNDGVKE